ncbi:DUF998 domain-containing protein [Microlunatus parietis]|uniref:DUF998 domain-containing protein n=1 Tax=Microlunatus parietis TaxID=682979 RepID=A0A7Y9LFP3_9ACTN|nr:DUF998 domain-containing protein [Microlunatus parietis]NYE75195.1 hypothetical protein [Microlunatus parietis]
MPITRSARPAPTSATPSVVATLSLISLVPMAVLHVTGTGLNPVVAPISHYVFVPGGYPMVLLGSLLLAGCGLVIAADLIRRYGSARARGPLAAAGLLISFAVALILVGLFPTDPPGSAAGAATLSAIIHRIGAAWSFLALPLAGVLVARTSGWCRAGHARSLVGLAIGLLGAVLIFLSIHLPLALAGSGLPAFGLLERIGFAFLIGYLILLAVALRPATTVAPPAAIRVPAREAVPVLGGADRNSVEAA